jgi:hypothetical protein
MAPREGQELTLAQALQQPEDVERLERIEHKLEGAERPYERLDEPRPNAEPPEKDR